MIGMWIYALQRATAFVLAPLVLVHLGLIVYAVRGGLSAEEILSRTQGSVGWALFYGVFVVAAAVHGAIGVRSVLTEWTPIGEHGAGAAAGLLGIALLALGLRAVWAVVGG